MRSNIDQTQKYHFLLVFLDQNCASLLFLTAVCLEGEALSALNLTDDFWIYQYSSQKYSKGSENTPGLDNKTFLNWNQSSINLEIHYSNIEYLKFKLK